jgi:hypothetical protein
MYSGIAYNASSVEGTTTSGAQARIQGGVAHSPKMSLSGGSKKYKKSKKSKTARKSKKSKSSKRKTKSRRTSKK